MRPFLAILWRDLFVTWRELPSLLAQVLLQPLFRLFVFGKVLGSLGLTQPGFAQLLFPGVVALTAFLTAVQTTPLLFTGATQYPWPALDALRWFQVVTAIDPLTYVSEGLRGTLTPSTPHVPTALCVAVLVGFLALSTATGVRGFLRRALD